MAPSAIATAQGISGTIIRTTNATTMTVSATAPYRETRDRTPLRAQVARRRIEGGVEQHGRDEQRERELGIELNPRRPGHERQQRASQRDERGIGGADPARQRREAGTGQEQHDDELEDVHVDPAVRVTRARSAWRARRPSAAAQPRRPASFATVSTTSAGSMGFDRNAWKPTSSARRLCSALAKAVNAMAGRRSAP